MENDDIEEILDAIDEEEPEPVAEPETGESEEDSEEPETEEEPEPEPEIDLTPIIERIDELEKQISLIRDAMASFVEDGMVIAENEPEETEEIEDELLLLEDLDYD